MLLLFVPNCSLSQRSGAPSASGVYAPYQTGEDKLALHEKRYEDFQTVQRLKSYLAPIFYGNVDGWVPNGEWDTANESHRVQIPAVDANGDKGERRLYRGESGEDVASGRRMTRRATRNPIHIPPSSGPGVACVCSHVTTPSVRNRTTYRIHHQVQPTRTSS